MRIDDFETAKPARISRHFQRPVEFEVGQATHVVEVQRVREPGIVDIGNVISGKLRRLLKIVHGIGVRQSRGQGLCFRVRIAARNTVRLHRVPYHLPTHFRDSRQMD